MKDHGLKFYKSFNSQIKEILGRICVSVGRRQILVFMVYNIDAQRNINYNFCMYKYRLGQSLYLDKYRLCPSLYLDNHKWEKQAV